MENNFNNRDFEQFVKQNADQYRMFPSEKVWKEIHNTLHKRPRWYGIGLALLLLTTVSVTWVMLISANKNSQIADRLPVLVSPIPVKEQATPQHITKADAKPVIKPTRQTLDQDGSQQNLFTSSIAEPVTEKDVADELAPPALSAISAPISAALTPAPIIVTAPAYRQVKVTVPVQVLITKTAVEPITESQPAIAPAPTSDTVSLVAETEQPKDISAEAEKTVDATDINLLTIESVLNTYKHIPKKNKFSLQAFFTPTVSYRKLEENNSFISETRARGSASGTTVAIADVNNVVTHKPDFGLRLGVTGGYILSRRLTATAGLQFNVNKYDIKAYNYPSETATIALMTGTTRASSVEAETTYRNYSGSKSPDWLHNLYFSASLPLGLQMNLNAAGKTEIGIGGTIEPTYVLGNRAYILSTDYNHYAEVPSLIRKWNMSSSFEAYAGYSTGKLNWRIGPQVRYHLLSSFREQYPVKEHLFDFGLKVGIMLNK